MSSRHHTLVHTEGLRLDLQPDRTLTVHTRTGQHVEHDLPLPWAPAAKLPPVGPDTLPPDWWGDRLDLGYAIAALLTSTLTRCAA